MHINSCLFIWLGGGEHKGGLLDLDPGLMIWTVITFSLLLIVLGRYAWKPVIRMLQERETRIRGSLEAADKARREAETLMERNNEILARAELEAQKIIREALESAEHLKLDIIRVANTAAAEFRNTAVQDMQRELTAARMQLQGEVADLAVRSAEKIIRTSLNDEHHKKIIDDVIRDLSGPGTGGFKLSGNEAKPLS